MSDLLLKLANSPISNTVIKSLGLPKPVPLARAQGGRGAAPLHGKHALLLAAEGGFASAELRAAIETTGASVLATADETTPRLNTLVFDATGCNSPDGLRRLYEGFHPLMRRLARNGRILVVAADPASLADPVAAASARAVEGFVRALAKETGKQGICANLAYVSPPAVDRLAGVVDFFCGPRCTYVTGQAIRVDARANAAATTTSDKPLRGKRALVTGSARGIGLSIAQRLAEDGAQVICLDVAAARDALYDTALKLGGTPLVLDISAPGAATELADFLHRKFGGVDIVVHNAGITRDKTLANMTALQWDLVMAINFSAITDIDRTLVARGLLHDAGRIICLSSISGIAGNFGQTNYATTKAALVGYVAALAPRLATQGITVNAVAPGFIETPMTARIPLLTREAGRRLNSLSQGGQPRDVAELVCFLASPDAVGVTGNTIRVCGQALIGA